MTMTSSDMDSPERDRRHPHRRVHSEEYKRRILDEYDASSRKERGELLRREGLYNSHLTQWRRAYEAGRLGDKPPSGRAAIALEKENARLRAELAKRDEELRATKAVLDIMGKASGLLRSIADRQEPPTPPSKS